VEHHPYMHDNWRVSQHNVEHHLNDIMLKPKI